MFGFLLADTDAPVLERREYGGGDVGVVHLLAAPAVEAACQQAAGVDGHWCQLRFTLEHIPDGEDVGHVGLLLRRVDLAGLGVGGHAGCVQVEVWREGSAAGGDEHRVE